MCTGLSTLVASTGGVASAGGAGLSLGLQAMGALTSAVGTFANAKAARSEANANATLAETQARDALRRGEDEEAKRQLATAQLKGDQRASMAARGLDLTEGSPLSILNTTDVMGEADAATIRENAYREASGYYQQAANYRTKADQSNPWLQGTSSLLTGAGTVAEKWYQYKSAGALKKAK